MLNRPHYFLLTWPESQVVMEQPWFNECQLAQEPDASYFVPVKHEDEVQLLLMEQDRMARIALVEQGIIGDEEITGVFHGDQ